MNAPSDLAAPGLRLTGSVPAFCAALSLAFTLVTACSSDDDTEAGPSAAGGGAGKAATANAEGGDGIGGGSSGGSGGAGIGLELPAAGAAGASTAGCDPAKDDCNCSAVDILFVVDNSGTMAQHAPTVTSAFRSFVDEMTGALPNGTSLHVGVTRGTGLYDQPSLSFWNPPSCEYMSNGTWNPPDTGTATGVDGQQGRLFEHDGRRFYSIEVGEDTGNLEGWFQGALAGAIERSDNDIIETVVASAAYALHEANAPVNDGFLRQQAVLVLFLLSDAPDMSPVEISTQDYIDMVTLAKADCGQKCIVTTGAIAAGCYDNPDLVNTRLPDFLGGFGRPPISYTEFGTDQELKLQGVLGTALSEAIVETCKTIPPTIY